MNIAFFSLLSIYSISINAKPNKFLLLTIIDLVSILKIHILSTKLTLVSFKRYSSNHEVIKPFNY